MTRYLVIFTAFLAALALAVPSMAQNAGAPLPERMVGDAKSPIVIDEYISLTCPHCSDFYLTTLPELEKRYVKTGKVRIVMHDYPLDGASLKAASLARCMPADEYFPFIQLLYENLARWATAPDVDKILVGYAKLGGLDEQRAKQCLNDEPIQNAIIADRNSASDQYGISSTPTFIFNKGVEKMEGASNIDGFAAMIDRMLAHTRK